MSVIDKLIQAWKEADEHERFIIQQRQRQAELARYQEKYWKIALILWEVTCANSTQLKVIPQKLPKQQATQDYIKPKSLYKHEYRLKRTPGNDIMSDGRVFKHEVKKILFNELLSLSFANFNIDITEDDNYYFVTIYGNNIIIGLPLSPRTGKLFINEFYNALNDVLYPAYDVQYSTSTHGEIKDGFTLLLYSQGEFVPSVTRRDPTTGNVFLSRRPVCSSGNTYLAVV